MLSPFDTLVAKDWNLIDSNSSIRLFNFSEASKAVPALKALLERQSVHLLYLCNLNLGITIG